MSRLLRWSGVALGVLVVLALAAFGSSANGEQLMFRGDRPTMFEKAPEPASQARFDGAEMAAIGRRKMIRPQMAPAPMGPMPVGYYGSMPPEMAYPQMACAPEYGPAGCGPGCEACGENCGVGCNCGPGCGTGCDCGSDCACGPMYGCGGDCNCGSGCSCGTYDCCDGCDMPCGPCCDVEFECVPKACRTPRVVMFGEYLYLQVTDADVTHAQQQDGIGGAGTVPFGDIGTVEIDHHPGYRVGGLIGCGPCSGVSFSYTQFESDSSSSLDAPVIPGGGGAVGSLVHHPGAALTASSGPVDADYEVDFQLADVMWQNIWRCGPQYTVHYMIGAEYGHLDQDFAQTGIFGGGSSGAIDTTTTIDFDGGGLKAGLDGERRFKHGLAVYGRATAAALSGRFTSRYTMFNQSTDQLLAQANWKDDRLVGHFDCEIGFACYSMDEHWRTSVGYMFSQWTNMITTSEFINGVQFDNYVRLGDTIGFDGLVGRLECRW